MDQNNERKRRLSPRMIAILVLALIVLAEGAFLLLHHKQTGGSSTDQTVAASTKPDETASDDDKADAPDTAADATADPQTTDSADQTKTDSTDKSGSKSGDSKSDGSKSDGNKSDGNSSNQAPTETPAVSIPPENREKPYAAAIAALANYAKTPSEGTLAYLLGGELMGAEMQKFLPALLTMSGQSVDLLYTQMDAAMELPEKTTALTITDAQPLSETDVSTARDRVRTMETSFSAIAQSFNDYAAFTDDEWASIGKQLGLSGAEAKQMISDLTTSSRTMAGLLKDADISEAYLVTMKTDTGETAQTNVYCISGKWVTTAFFNMEFA